MKELNKILDDKIEKKQAMSLKKSPKTKNNSFAKNSSKSFVLEIENNEKIICIQKNEIKQLESRIMQVSKEDYYENISDEIKKVGSEIEKIKKEKRAQANSNNLNAKSLENIVEIKGLPENLQKSAIIDSDLLIMRIKNKSLMEKIQQINKKLAETQNKNEKAQEDLEKVCNEATELKIKLKQNTKKYYFDDLQAKCNRFQKLVDSMKTKEKKETQKQLKEINELKLKIQEKEKILAEQNDVLLNARGKLSSLLANENIDKNLKDLVSLFTNSNQNNSEISVVSSNKNVSVDLNVDKSITKADNKKEILEKRVDYLNEDKIEIFDSNLKENKKNDEHNSSEMIDDIIADEKTIKNNEEIIFKEQELNNENFEEIIEKDNNIIPNEKQDKPNKFFEEKSSINNENLGDISQKNQKSSIMIESNENHNDLSYSENNKNKPDILNSNEINPAKSLKKFNEEGCGKLIISPKKFTFAENSQNNLKMIFCQIKSGKASYNTKICEEKNKPSWDENIEIRTSVNENCITAQVWNFDTKSTEQLIGETNIDLNSKEINIFSKKIFTNEFLINNNGNIKGKLLMEIEWIADNENEK